MNKKILSIGAVALLSLSLAACGDKEKEVQPAEVDHSQHQAEAPAPEKVETPVKEDQVAEVTPTGNVVEVTISAKNFEFDVKEIKANVGDTVKVTLDNATGLHGVAFDGLDQEVQGGETIEFMVTEAGEFSYNCSIPCGVGHDKMSGKLIVS